MKKFNKILSLLVVFAMALSMLPTSALAVVNEYKAETETESKYVEGLPAGDRDLMNSLKENYPQQAGNSVSTGAGITATQIKNPSVSLQGNMQDYLINGYAQDEFVRVIVVLEGAPLLDQGFTTDEIAANGEDVQYQVSVMHSLQDTLVADINLLIQDIMPDTFSGKIEAKYNFSVTMNGVAVEVPYGIVDEIAELNGVKSAYVAPQYNVPEDMTSGDATPNMVTTQMLAGSALTWDAGYTGAGMRIAVIDTGLDIDHPSFVGDVPVTETSLTVEEINAVLENLNAYKRYAGLSASALYNSVKVPYRFNYVDHDLDVTHDNDSAGDHGTHVAGIAAANKIDTSKVVGVAPEAQLIAMKVFGKNGGAYWDDIVAALEDCFWLNVDAVNMSLGSPSGFTWESDDLTIEFVEVMARIEQSDMIASVSAGNSYSAGCSNYWYELLVGAGLASYFPELIPGHNQTIDPANGVVSSPATFIGATVVASLENNTTAVEVMVATDGVQEHIFTFGDNYTYFTYYLGGNGDFQNHEYDYVVIPGVGAETDYEGIDVKGKIALVERGELAFTDKQIIAGKMGAVGIIVYDNGNSGEIFYMQNAGVIPNVTVIRADGLKLVELAGDDGIGTLIVRYNNVIIAENAVAGTMSDFSSWGVTPDLRLVPDITSYGGNIYSTYTDGEYGIMSGTSMSAPHIAGMSALVLQYLRGSGYEVLASESDYHLVAEALLMSTAEPVAEPSGVLYSPRKQGAGNANIYKAINSPAYLTVNGGAPSVSFGDDDARNGEYTFSFELNNLTDIARTYILDGTALTDQFHEYFYQISGVKLMGETSRELDAEFKFYVSTGIAPECDDYNGDTALNMKDVQAFLDDVNFGIYNSEFDLNKDGKINTADVQALYEMIANISNTEVDRVVVPANGTVTVSVTLTLTEDDMAYMDENYPNGIFVEGFVRAYSAEENGVDLGLPFMGFYGDWSDARVFDTYSWYHEGMELPERYASILWTDSTNGVGAGGNPYEASLVRFDPNYEPEIYGAVVSPNGDGVNDYIDDIYLSLMRNAKLVQFNWYDEDGNLVDQYDADYARQSSYQSNYGQIVPFVYSWWFADTYDFTDGNGNYLPNGSKVTLSIDFYLDDGDWEVDDNTSVVVTVDSIYPDLKDIDFNYDEKTNKRELVITVADDTDIAAVALLTRMGSVVEMVKPSEKNAVVNKDGSFTLTFDVSEMDDQFVLVVGDYGGNEAYYNIEFTDGTNHVRQDAFYGYRNLINYVPGNGYIYLLDSYNGWHSFADDDATSMLMHTSMYTEGETAVVAADYVDGYIIAIDSEGAIFAMKAGDWTRIPVGEFLLSRYADYADNPVLDMTYDFANNVMYVLTDESYAGAGGHLATIDLLTGAVTDRGIITMPEGHPGQLLTLAADNDGVLYAVSYVAGAEAGDEYTGDLYIVDVENITTSGSGYWAKKLVPVKYVGETGYVPDYRQSMTVDHDTNELYWMAYANPYAKDPATFFEVDKATGKLTVVSDVEYDSWMTAIFKPYTAVKNILPEAELEAINLDKLNIAMSVGARTSLTATPYPYYADLGELTWTSSDESVAIVRDGVIYCVGEGRVEITVTSGEVTASCMVDVVNLQSDLTMYDWGSDSPAWITLNATAPGNAVVLEGALTPSNPYYGFMAAAYFNEWLYTYDSAGGFYRVDPETMQGALIGSAQATLFAMAFNYDDGFMYAIEQQQVSMWESAYNLVRVNLNNGAIERVCTIDSAYVPMCGMAIDHDGNFYSVMGDYYSGGLLLMKWTMVDNEMVFDVIEEIYIDGIYSTTSMTYSDLDKGLYISDSIGQLLWIDINSIGSEDGARIVNAGTIGEQYSAMNMSMFTIPETEPKTPSVSVETVSVPETYMVLEGGSVAASVSVTPWNAYPEIKYSVADTSVAVVNEDGIVTGVKAGKTTLIITVEGVDATFERTITVLASTGYVNGYILDDFSGGGNIFGQFADTDPAYDLQGFYGDDAFNVFSGTYFNGKLYAYGQDQWGTLGYYYYFFSIDPNTFEMTEIARVAYNLRDMAFDYTTGNLYAIAQGGTLVGAVVQLDMETGEMTIIAETGVTFAAMTIDAKGQMYGIAEDDYLYAIDKKTGETTKIGHTGVDVAALYQSMHYDLDTGNVYWSQVAGDQTSSLRLVDLKTGVTSGLGTISPTGAMVTMLYTIPENEPTEPKGDAVEAGIVITEKATTHVGGTVQLDATILADVELQVPGATSGLASTEGMTITWTSSDETIATVDENGLVTGVAAGSVTITAKVGEYEDTCSVTITAEARKYYAYDKSNTQWVSFDGKTVDTYGNFVVDVKREDAEGEHTLQATFYVQQLDLIYAISEHGHIYSIDPDTFVRTAVGTGLGNEYATTVTVSDWWGDTWEEEVVCDLKAVDMSYDNGKLYAVMIAENEDAWVEMSIIVEIDMATGEMEVLFESQEIHAANLYVENGRAFMVDSMMSGMINYVDLYADEQKLVQDSLIKLYWGDPWSGAALFEDELTGVIYAIRDMTDTYGTFDYETYEMIPWDGVTGDSVLYILGLSDGSAIRLGEIGNNIVVRGMFIR